MTTKIEKAYIKSSIPNKKVSDKILDIIAQYDEGGAVISVNGESGVVTLSASDIPNTPNGDIASTNVQDAINEVRNDTDTKLAGYTQTVAGKSGIVTLEINDLSDVDSISQNIDDVLKWNGSIWTSGKPNQISAGAGVNYFLSANVDIASGYDLMSKIPDSDAEIEESVIVNNNSVLIDSYISDVEFGVSSIDSGVWSFNIFSYSSSILGNNSIFVEVYKRTNVGVETLLFTATNGSINNTVVDLYTFTSVQPAYPVNVTDKLVFKFYAMTDNLTDTTIYLVHSGSEHYSYINTPLIIYHNDLTGLQGGSSNENYHLTLSEYTGTGTGNFVRKVSPTLTGTLSIEGFRQAISSKTANYTLTSADYTVLCDGSFTITLPAAASALVGRSYIIKNIGTGNITVTANGSETIDGFNSQGITNQWDSMHIQTDSINWFLI